MKVRNDAHDIVGDAVARIEDLEAINAEEVIEAAIENITNCNDFIGHDGECERGRFEITLAGHDISLHDIGFTFEEWEREVKRHRGDWIESPHREDYPLSAAAVSEIEAVVEAVRADDDVAAREVRDVAWRRLTLSTKREIIGRVSEEVWSNARGWISDALVESLEDWIRDEIFQNDRLLAAHPDREVILISERASVVVMQGADFDDAERRLYAHGSVHGNGPERLVKVNPWSGMSGGHDFDIYSVPAGIDFRAQDVGLVQRWGDHEGSYASEVTGVTKAA
jgi:hypothetical protein